MERLFPDRKRCKTCGRALNTLVLKGQYDTYSCASMPQPGKNISTAPRSCKRSNPDGSWEWKKRYRYEGEVPKHLRDSPTVNIYNCEHCGCLHVGHSRVQPERERARGVLREYENLVTVVNKMLAQSPLPKREIAKRIGVPMIRITEIERGDTKIDAKALFALLYFLHLRLEVIEVS